MAGPIYRLWLMHPREAWYRMSQEEQGAYLAKAAESFQQAGGKTIVMCVPVWSNEQWAMAGVEEFPDIDAVQAHITRLFFMGHYHRFRIFNLLGTKWPEGDATQTMRPTRENPIFKVWMMRPTDAWYEMSEEERNAFTARSEQILNDAGGKMIVRCACGWSNERWALFGVEEFPSIEAAQQHAGQLTAAGHFRYSDGVSVLGTPWKAQ